MTVSPLVCLVGAEGFEPPTLCSQSRCATRLRYAPTLSFDCNANRNLAGFEPAAEIGQMVSEKPEKHPSGPKGPMGSTCFMRGLKPPPPSGPGFSAAC